MISLTGNTIDNEDIDALRDWLGTYPRLTKGEQTEKFELAWNNWLDIDYSLFVNSGSSANLLAFYTLIQAGRLSPGDAVAVPALSWSTDLAPVIQLGLVPILIDCDENNLCMDLTDFELKIIKHDIKAAIMVMDQGGRHRD